MSERELIAVRDPFGWRPLALGKLDGAYVLASETCAFDLIHAEFVREIEPGEVLIINENGLRSERPFPAERPAFCMFEYVYFSRPDSMLGGVNVGKVRMEMGRELARRFPVEADIVVPVPDSGVCAAMGYAEEAGIPLRMGLIRNHYVGRTFIEPKQSIRSFGVRIKLNPVRDLIAGRRVVLIDDSIVRGTTSKKIVRMVREAGATEVHMRISCPPTISPCFYGVDTPYKKDLIASHMTVEEIRQFIEADSLGYLSLEGMLEATGISPDSSCTACWTCRYPTRITREAETQWAREREPVPSDNAVRDENEAAVK